MKLRLYFSFNDFLLKHSEVEAKMQEDGKMKTYLKMLLLYSVLCNLYLIYQTRQGLTNMEWHTHTQMSHEKTMVLIFAVSIIPNWNKGIEVIQKKKTKKNMNIPSKSIIETPTCIFIFKKKHINKIIPLPSVSWFSPSRETKRIWGSQTPTQQAFMTHPTPWREGMGSVELLLLLLLFLLLLLLLLFPFLSDVLLVTVSVSVWKRCLLLLRVTLFQIWLVKTPKKKDTGTYVHRVHEGVTQAHHTFQATTQPHHRKSLEENHQIHREIIQWIPSGFELLGDYNR